MARTTCILLVEDDSEVRASLRRVLMAENYNVLVAANTAEALHRLNVEQVDIALIDHGLAEANNWRLIAELREAAPRLCTIVMSAEADPQMARLRTDISVLVEKPLNLPLLISKIQDLSLHRARIAGLME